MKVFQRVLLLGGGFDPMHRGHIESSLHVKHQQNHDLLIFIPTGVSPHKQGKKKTANHIRRHIMKLSLDGIDGVVIEEFELLHKGVCYFYETIEYLANKHSGAKISFMVGGDWGAKLGRWREWNLIRSLATPIIITRPGYKINKSEYEVIEVPGVPISGTELRSKLEQGLYDDERVKSYIYPKALTFIREQKVYENTDLVNPESNLLE